MSGTQWIESNGGPLLVLPEALLPAWSGIDVPADGRTVEADFRWSPGAAGPSDYDRACDVSNWTGVLPVGAGWGLVLGDMPSPTSWRPAPDGGGVFARWSFAEDHASADAALAQLPGDLAWEMLDDFEVVAAPLVLFDSAEPGTEPLGERAAVDLAPGVYRVSHTTYRADAQTEFTLVRLQPRAV